MIQNTNDDVDNNHCQLVASVAATLYYFSKEEIILLSLVEVRIVAILTISQEFNKYNS